MCIGLMVMWLSRGVDFFLQLLPLFFGGPCQIGKAGFVQMFGCGANVFEPMFGAPDVLARIGPPLFAVLPAVGLPQRFLCATMGGFRFESVFVGSVALTGHFLLQFGDQTLQFLQVGMHTLSCGSSNSGVLSAFELAETRGRLFQEFVGNGSIPVDENPVPGDLRLQSSNHLQQLGLPRFCGAKLNLPFWILARERGE